MHSFKYTLLMSLYCTTFLCNAMEKPLPVIPAAAGASIQAGYDSDSENEGGYVYHGLPHLKMPEGLGPRCLALTRGVHFSSTFISKQERSRMRKADESGLPIYSSAAYDIARKPLGSVDEQGVVQEAAISIREKIRGLSEEQRRLFQEIYSNNYEGFHSRLSKPDPRGIFSQFISQKNPQVSTSEYIMHGARYAAGVKFLGTGVEHLDPEYDLQGKPKHPYLGKLYVMLVDEAELEELTPYFVVWAHANAQIKVSDHFRKNVLAEREVSFPGYIPGKCVVLSVPVRVPSFVGGYKPWYLDKYGLTQQVFKNKKKAITTGAPYRKTDKRTPKEVKESAVNDLLEKYIVPHLNEISMKHIKLECDEQHKTLVYKKLGDGFGTTLVPLVNASSLRQAIVKGEKKDLAEFDTAS